MHCFRKMHGLGNDFVIFDGRTERLDLSADQLRHIADRRCGIGCDQVITLRPSDTADVFMQIHNADGSEVTACGNASRCVGDLLMTEKDCAEVTLETGSGILKATRQGSLIRVDMGVPRRHWTEIPLSQHMDSDHLELTVGPLSDPVAVNVGNPHVIFFVRNVEAVNLETLGPEIEHHPLFPERVNVSIVEDQGGTHLRQRIWERGAGITRACGSAACAAVVAATVRGIVDHVATIQLDGGDLLMAWDRQNHIQMTGGVSPVYQGEINLDLLS